MLSSLPDNWETLVVSPSNSSLDGLITLAILKNCMLNKEAKRKEQKVSSHNEALIMKRKERASIGTPNLTRMVAVLNHGKDLSLEVADVTIMQME